MASTRSGRRSRRSSNSGRGRRGTSSSSSRSRSSGASSSGSSRGGSRRGLSPAAKVAIVTTAGAAVAATAAGLATTQKGRELRRKVTRKVKDLVNQGSITLKKAGLGDVVQEFEHMIGGMLSGDRGERYEGPGNRGRSYESNMMMERRGRRSTSHRSR